MSDPRKFLISSDYPMDKIAYMKAGAITLTGGNSQIEIVHELPFTPLVMGSWSLTPDFSSSREFGKLIYASPSIDRVILDADATSLGINAHFADDGTKIIYYLIYAFAPSDYTGEVVALSINTGFRMDSRLNYMKLYAEDVVDMSGASPVAINHNLGYLPRVLVWVEADGIVEKVAYDDIISQLYKLTNTQLIINNSYYYNRAHYRIYCDD